MDQGKIIIKKARSNNLKGIDVEIPRGKLTVVTGLSGSGKTSFAFDTLYAEGQRRYVESLSSYARQFMGRMPKPDVEFIHGLPPAIAIGRQSTTRNPRSTVGTATEIYDYLRLLMARVGVTTSPVSGNIVKKHTVVDVLAAAAALPPGTRLAVVAPMVVPDGRKISTQLDVYQKNGYSRMMMADSGDFVTIADMIAADDVNSMADDRMELLIDRLAAGDDPDEVSRLAESAETAFVEGDGRMALLAWADGNDAPPRRYPFSTRFEADGMSFIEPTEQLFNFNNPYGACPRCEGYGRILGIDESLVIPDDSLSVYDGAVAPWRGEKTGEWRRRLISLSTSLDFPIHRAYCDLSQQQRDLLWHGNDQFGGIDGFFKMLENNMYKIQCRVMLARYRGKTTCPDCHGSRLRPEASLITVGGLNLPAMLDMPVRDLYAFFEGLTFEGNQKVIASRLITEIKSRLGYLVDVGLGYLTLGRRSSTLSGGESQRVSLASALGSNLTGSLYVIDEPSIGLHPRDTRRLISVLKRLRDVGNTVVVVEHDEEIMQAADYIVDIGPGAGSCGGEVVWQGPTADLTPESAPLSHTARYLALPHTCVEPGTTSAAKTRARRPLHITVEGASAHNLRHIDVDFPLGMITSVTGVSGSGKTTLVRDILYRALARHLGGEAEAPGAHRRLSGDLSAIRAVEMIDRDPIGRSSRSNPATYIKAFDDIRRLFASEPLAVQMGFTAATFSFNTPGGRCEQCKGEGTVTIAMQFMADIVMTCEDCHGQRFKADVLSVRHRGKSIADVLGLTVSEAIAFFSDPDAGDLSQRIARKLQPLADVGLGYLTLGQSSSTLSGGENQRLKLASTLAAERDVPTLFIFDEPTSGLHSADVDTLVSSLRRLIERGHTIVAVEHNVRFITASDHVIDLGPDAGDGGGELVAQGSPREIADRGVGPTADALRAAFQTSSGQ